jgi:DNA repair exonuclease SbcCD ATPase subunit
MRRLLLIAVALMMLASSKPRMDGYILSASADNVTFSGGVDFSYFKTFRERHPGKVLWARRNGREYVVRDETLIMRAQALFAPQAALAPEQEAISREEEALDREEERLEDAANTAENRRRLDEVRAKQAKLAEREQALDEREEEIERIAERELWKLVDAAIKSGAATAAR